MRAATRRLKSLINFAVSHCDIVRAPGQPALYLWAPVKVVTGVPSRKRNRELSAWIQAQEVSLFHKAQALASLLNVSAICRVRLREGSSLRNGTFCHTVCAYQHGNFYLREGSSLHNGTFYHTVFTFQHGIFFLREGFSLHNGTFYHTVVA